MLNYIISYGLIFYKTYLPEKVYFKAIYDAFINLLQTFYNYV